MKEIAAGERVRVEPLEGEAVWRVVLAAPKANVLDHAMIEGLTHVFQEARTARGLKCLLIEGEGANFSFGASVPEHLPGEVNRMLPGFHGLFRALFDSCVFSVAAVRGQCLGGGMELAMFCNRVVAAPDAKFGQPEIRLAVFAPVASVMLPARVGQARAEDLCVSGRIVDAGEALRIGLADEVAEDPAAAALEYIRANLLGKSAVALHHAVWALREPLRVRVEEDLHRVEQIYLTGLMSTRDAEEGLRAFLEKREPRWSDA